MILRRHSNDSVVRRGRGQHVSIVNWQKGGAAGDSAPCGWTRVSIPPRLRRFQPLVAAHGPGHDKDA